MKKLLFILTLLFGLGTKAQVTQIPDENFEQALLDLGIDTDGELNGQVNTADIENVTELDISERGISDLTGIEGFAQLESLDCGNALLSELNLQYNLQLKKLSIGINDGLPGADINKLDLSNNSNLENLQIFDLPYLQYVNLKNGNNIILTLVQMDCNFEEWNCGPYCIEVDDMEVAENNEFPYSEWELWSAVFATEEECALGHASLTATHISLYPNPVHSQLNIKSGFPLDKLEIYTLQGKMVMQQNLPRETVSLENLPTGVYFVKVYTQDSALIQKIIKK